MPIIRSISGLRATLGSDVATSLTPELLCSYALAFSSILPEGAIVVGRDGRPSGEWISEIIIGSLRACGREVRYLDIVPTPTVQLITEHSNDVVGGIAITASHNPAQWNGLKFIGADGVFLDAEQNAQLWNALDTKSFRLSHEQQSGSLIHIDDAIEQHIASVLALPIFTQDKINSILSRSFTVVVDAVNCSGSVAIPTLLRRLGCNVIELYCDSSGIFPHTPEPLPENLTELAKAVKEHSADLGLAIDPDADRLVLIGADGNPIGEEKTVMLAIEMIMRHKELFLTDNYKPNAVVNFSTSAMAFDAARRNGGECFGSPVGEINVVRAMQYHNAIVGGEGSGGVIVPACHLGRDSLVGTALVIALMSECSTDEWHLLINTTPYSMIKYKQEVSGNISPVFDAVASFFRSANDMVINREDGIRIDFPNKWIQLRASNTEPIIRIISEAPTHSEAEQLLNEVRGVIANSIS